MQGSTRKRSKQRLGSDLKRKDSADVDYRLLEDQTSYSNGSIQPTISTSFRETACIEQEVSTLNELTKMATEANDAISIGGRICSMLTDQSLSD